MKKQPLSYTNVFLFLVFITALIIYLYNCITFYIGAGRDDVFISLWAGKALSEGRGLINYNGESVEMASSLLHVLIIAGINLILPYNLYVANKLCGILAGLMVFFVIYRNASLLFVGHTTKLLAFSISMLLLANNPSWLYWNAGGLETPYQSLILFLYGIYVMKYWRTSRGVLGLSILQILYLLVRPEGFILILFTIIFCITYRLFRKTMPEKQIAILLGLPILVFMLVSSFRYLKFGAWFPNPVYAKIGTDILNHAGRVIQGFAYLKDFYASNFYVTIQGVVLIGICVYYLYSFRTGTYSKNRDESSFFWWIWLILMNHLFIILSGGDWMEFFRFIVPIEPLLIVMTTNFLVTWFLLFYRKCFKTPLRYGGIVCGIGMFLLSYGYLQSQHTVVAGNQNTDGIITLHDIFLSPSMIEKKIMLRNWIYKRDYEAMMFFIENKLPVLYEQLGRRLVMVTKQMGFVPYHIKEKYPDLNIQFIDTRGLTDRYISQLSSPRETTGVVVGKNIDQIVSGRMHEISQYVLAKKPNMIYMLGANQEERRNIENSGWCIVWDKPGAVVFIKQ